jgi:ferredoxin-thioredoxin reductase catalytic subunit
MNRFTSLDQCKRYARNVIAPDEEVITQVAQRMMDTGESAMHAHHQIFGSGLCPCNTRECKQARVDAGQVDGPPLGYNFF